MLGRIDARKTVSEGAEVFAANLKGWWVYSKLTVL